MNPLDTSIAPTERRRDGGDDEERRLSRRSFMRLGTAAGLGALLALTACGNGDEDEDEDEDDD